MGSHPRNIPLLATKSYKGCILSPVRDDRFSRFSTQVNLEEVEHTWMDAAATDSPLPVAIAISTLFQNVFPVLAISTLFPNVFSVLADSRRNSV